MNNDSGRVFLILPANAFARPITDENGNGIEADQLTTQKMNRKSSFADNLRTKKRTVHHSKVNSLSNQQNCEDYDTSDHA